jgi:hypothetical protein
VEATEIARAVVRWATETCPDLNSVYDHDADQILDALPIAMAAVTSEQDTASQPSLGLEVADVGLEQAVLHVANASIEFLVNDDDEASAKLEGFVGQLAGALRSERESGEITLGDRVEGASPYWQASYEPPFAVFDDSTKARRADFTLAVAELL